MPSKVPSTGLDYWILYLNMFILFNIFKFVIEQIVLVMMKFNNVLLNLDFVILSNDNERTMKEQFREQCCSV